MDTTTILIIVLFVLVFAIIVFSLSAKVSGTRYRYEEYNRHLNKMEDNLERLSTELGNLRINTILAKNSDEKSKESQPPCFIIQQPQPVSVTPEPVIIKVITETDRPEIKVIKESEITEPVEEVIKSKVDEVYEEELILARKKLIAEAKAQEEARVLKKAETEREERRLSQERALLEAKRLEQGALEEERINREKALEKEKQPEKVEVFEEIVPREPVKERVYRFDLPEMDEWEIEGEGDLDSIKKEEPKITPRFLSVTDSITRSGRNFTEEELKQQIRD